MTERAQDLLRTLLFGSERELVNFKFCPGAGVRDPGDLCAAAYSALSDALGSDMADMPPVTGLRQMTAADLLAAA